MSIDVIKRTNDRSADRLVYILRAEHQADLWLQDAPNTLIDLVAVDCKFLILFMINKAPFLAPKKKKREKFDLKKVQQTTFLQNCWKSFSFVVLSVQLMAYAASWAVFDPSGFSIQMWLFGENGLLL